MFCEQGSNQWTVPSRSATRSQGLLPLSALRRLMPPLLYRNNRKNRYAIRHIGKETKYINLWDHINLRNSSAEGTIIRWWEKPTDRKLLKSCSVKLLGSAERNVNGWISALIGIIPNSFGSAERIIEMTIFVSLLLFQYLKDHFRLGIAERWWQQSCVICPQGDVSCTCGALYVAKPRWLFYVVAQRAGCYFLLIALDSATTCGRIVCYILSPHCRDNLKSMWYFNHANKQEQLASRKLLLFWQWCTLRTKSKMPYLIHQPGNKLPI